MTGLTVPENESESYSESVLKFELVSSTLSFSVDEGGMLVLPPSFASGREGDGEEDLGLGDLDLELALAARMRWNSSGVICSALLR